MFAILAIQLIILGLVWMMEGYLHRRVPQPSFWRRRWRSIFVASYTFVHIVTTSFMYGAELL